MLDMKKIQGMQKELDDYIFSVREVDKVNYYKNTVIALRVEVAELFNELAFFKHWKKSHEISKERVLEEFADCLHFFASLANHDNVCLEYNKPNETDEYRLAKTLRLGYETLVLGFVLQADFESLIDIMRIYNFNYEEMEQAYIKKNQENWKRMREGY